MSSTLAVSLHDHDAHNREPRNDLSAAASPNDQDSVSPNTLNHFETPGASSSAVSCYSDFDEDPFLGVVDWTNTEGVPSFLKDELAGWQPLPAPTSANTSTTVEPVRHAVDSSYPLTPDQTASIRTSSPHSERRFAAHPYCAPTASISPQELQKPFNKPNPIITQPSQLTPSQSSSARTSEDGLAPARANMPAQSPRVTVSVWDQDENAPTHTRERTFEDSPTTSRGGFFSAGDLISSHVQDSTSAPRDATGRWKRDPFTGQAGLAPNERPSDEVPSINELEKSRRSDERNEEVGMWLSRSLSDLSAPAESQDLQALERTRSDSDDGVPITESENRYIDGQTYYDPNGGPMTEQDREIIAGDRNWADPPMIHQIMPGVPGRHQPPTAQAAIERFERMCRDNDSILSRQATWGTRRRSIHSTADIDVDGILSGNFLKKLSISKNPDRGTNKAGSLLKEVHNFIRRPSISSLRKRRGSSASNASNASDDGQQETGSPLEKRDSTGSPHLAPPTHTSSWGKKVRPSVNTSVGSSANPPTATGNNHVRKRSVGAISITSPKSFFQSLKVENTLQRPRSRSEAPKPTSTPDSAESHPNILGLWKQSGGPPVASLSRASANMADPEDEDEEEDDLQDDNEMTADANLIDKITPNFSGFQQHVMELNPHMDGHCNYLVDRIAHQQVVRYKSLLSHKVKHLNLGANCPCGSLCIALGGQANPLDQKGDANGLDPLASHFPDDEDGGTPTDGAISQDSFPKDIPMPPAQQLPAEFECQLCYSCKKFTKPSDWTKHVHEDVQPFTCTWDKCRDAKSFKRKADWVRHENEGHRHLEWWTCDVEECRHTCYRRDNFLQHLVREHKFPEPKIKTKAAIKKAGGADPTWRKVEECHALTGARPQDEPCRFCGKSFPTWKKLTVHLAKHMEQISLPVLRLVAAKAKEISADTIISPVQDPPQRPAFTLPSYQDATMQHHQYTNQQQVPPNIQYPDQGYHMVPVMPPVPQYGAQGYYPPQPQTQYGSVGHTLQQGLTIDTMNHGFGQGHNMQEIPVTSTYGPVPNQYMAPVPAKNTPDSGLEPFPQYSDLGHGLPNGVEEGVGVHHLGYDHLVEPPTASASPFSGHGSASPYMRSPHQNANGADLGYEDRGMRRYP